MSANKHEDKKEMLLLENMIKIRTFEENVVDLFKQDFIHGTTHVYIGEEAVAVGALTQADEKDYVVSTHRGHGHCIAKGADLQKMLCEILGRKNGYCGGKGGSMHIADFSRNMLGANGIVGAGLTLSLGPALASQLRGDKLVTFCFFGDGASHIGSFHEALNLAGRWKLPIVFICENNYFAVATSFERSSASDTVAQRGEAYNIPGVRIDGNDVLKVQEEVGKAIARARAGEGPSLIECMTYRWEGHYVGEPALYRTSDELNAWKEKDPIKQYSAYLIKHKIATKTEIDELWQYWKNQLKEIVEIAKNSLEPDREDLYTHVFAD